jgi:hypothetical protein
MSKRLNMTNLTSPLRNSLMLGKFLENGINSDSLAESRANWRTELPLKIPGQRMKITECPGKIGTSGHLASYPVPYASP